MKLKKNNGITLVALIITIIIMLILAGVAISIISGDSNFWEKVILSSKAYNKSAQNEYDIIESLSQNFGDLEEGEEEFPLTEPGKYTMTINAGAKAIWLGVDLTGSVIPVGAEVKMYFKTSDDRQNWSETAEDIAVTDDSQYLKATIELIPNEAGECPQINSAMVRFKVIATKEPIVTLDGMEEDEDGNYILSGGTGGTGGRVEQVIELEGQKVDELILPIMTKGALGISNQNGSLNGNISGGSGSGASTVFLGSQDGNNWVPFVPGNTYNYVKAVTTVDSLPEGASVGSLIVNPLTKGSKDRIKPIKEWEVSKSETYTIDAVQTGYWKSLEKDETIYEGTKITYYFATSNDNVTWSQYNENIGGSSRYLKMLVQYSKSSSSIKKDAVLNDWFINYEVADEEGGYIIRQSGDIQYTPEIISNEKRATLLTGSGILPGCDQIVIKYSLKSFQPLYKTTATNNEWTKYVKGTIVNLEKGDTIYMKGIDIFGNETAISEYTNTSSIGCTSRVYDNDLTNYDVGTNKMAVDESAWGKQVHIKFQGVNQDQWYIYGSVFAKDAEGTSTTLVSSRRNFDGNVTIPENTVELSFNFQQNVRLYLVQIVE